MRLKYREYPEVRSDTKTKQELFPTLFVLIFCDDSDSNYFSTSCALEDATYGEVLAQLLYVLHQGLHVITKGICDQTVHVQWALRVQWMLCNVPFPMVNSAYLTVFELQQDSN